MKADCEDANVNRRDLIKTAMAFPLLAASRDGKASRLPSRVRPADPAWPNSASWEELKQRVGGNLIQVQPLFAACATDPKSAGCLDVVSNARNPFFLGDQPAGTQVSGWLDAWRPSASAYAVAARSAADVAAAVNFARKNNLRLVIKGGGHSYQGTSNASDSLLVWTRAMNSVTVHDAFVGKGCQGEQAPTQAVTLDAG